MACLTGNQGVGIVGRFSIMWEVALAAIILYLAAVAEMNRLDMTAPAIESMMGSRLIILFIDERNPFSGDALCVCSPVTVAMKTERRDILLFGRVLDTMVPMAGQALLIL